MKHRLTRLSILVSAIVAGLLIAAVDPAAVPVDEMPTYRPAPKVLSSPDIPLQLAAVTLPAPPAASMPPPIAVHVARQPVPVQPSPARVIINPLVAVSPAPDTLRRTAKNPLVTVRQPAIKPDWKAGVAPVAPSPPPMGTPTENPLGFAVATNDVKTLGRPLLKLLEYGEGPNIEIAWPRKGSQQARLFAVFNNCYGMRVALMGNDGRLYHQGSSRAKPWRPNSDRYSGFVRRSQGGTTGSETTLVNALRSQLGLPSGYAVRLFPRDADAILLGGLSQLIGGTYGRNKVITARYRLFGQRVFIEKIVADGIAVAGSIDLTPSQNPRCKI